LVELVEKRYINNKRPIVVSQINRIRGQ